MRKTRNVPGQRTKTAVYTVYSTFLRILSPIGVPWGLGFPPLLGPSWGPRKGGNGVAGENSRDFCPEGNTGRGLVVVGGTR